ncbi:MAG: hypothetical protein ACKPGK_02655, partial [Verrucomicrobiota bacterium]
GLDVLDPRGTFPPPVAAFPPGLIENQRKMPVIFRIHTATGIRCLIRSAKRIFSHHDSYLVFGLSEAVD